jgi:hypothetical protein
VIVIVGSRHDVAACELVKAWSSDGAALLSAEDLISPGWVFCPGDASRGSAVIAGQRVPVRELRAVLTRRPALLAEELHDIHSDDRAYVAAEINAMLVAWLTSLPCRVLNRPTPTSLCGPGWTTTHWQAAAAGCGLRSARNTALPTQSVVVCDGAVLGTRSPALHERALVLARVAGVSLLELRLRAGKLVAASAFPDLTSPAVRAAVRSALLSAVYA